MSESKLTVDFAGWPLERSRENIIAMARAGEQVFLASQTDTTCYPSGEAWLRASACLSLLRTLGINGEVNAGLAVSVLASMTCPRFDETSPLKDLIKKYVPLHDPERGELDDGARLGRSLLSGERLKKLGADLRGGA